MYILNKLENNDTYERRNLNLAQSHSPERLLTGHYTSQYFGLFPLFFTHCHDVKVTMLCLMKSSLLTS
jgi:hypothetical protein